MAMKTDDKMKVSGNKWFYNEIFHGKIHESLWWVLNMENIIWRCLIPLRYLIRRPDINLLVLRNSVSRFSEGKP